MVNMTEREYGYDPLVYGHVRADFLNRLSGITPPEEQVNDEEKMKQDILREIREGKLVVQK